jgi:3',5'-cyclic AMP phosphodiesterase CpdA
LRLLAVSDLHVRQAQNRAFVEKVAPAADDWLILGGDLGESEEDLDFVFATLAPRFAKLIWVPGNHELWTLDADPRGEAKYQRLVDVARRYGVLTPEDPYPAWPEDPKLVIAPLFLLYDYSFCPDDVTDPIAWAAEEGIRCADEVLLWPDPYPTREAWCRARCDLTAARLDALPADTSTILVNHFPLRQAHARLPLVPRFSIWCGTRRTEDWHLRYRAKAVVFGHLHIRQERVVDGVRFHEVSLGYKRQWNPDYPERYIRQIWPQVD